MTQTFAVDATNDPVVGDDGALVVLRGVEAVAQASYHAARVRLTECVLDALRGIPFERTVWTGAPDVGAYESALRGALLAVADVRSIVNLTVRRERNTLRYVAVLSTIYGPVTLNG